MCIWLWSICLYSRDVEQVYMKCWVCNTELIWGGDQDLEDDEEHKIITNLSCPECEAYVEVYHGKVKND